MITHKIYIVTNTHPDKVQDTVNIVLQKLGTLPAFSLRDIKYTFNSNGGTTIFSALIIYSYEKEATEENKEISQTN